MNTISVYEDKYNRFEYKPIQYEIEEISPILELYRYELIQQIKKECTEYLLSNNIKIDINNIFPRWMMLQFHDSIYYIDPIIPWNGKNNSQLQKDLYYLSHQKISLNKANEIINELQLNKKCNKAIRKIRKWMKMDIYHKQVKELSIETFLHENMYVFTFVFQQKKYSYRLHKNIVHKMHDFYSGKKILNQDFIQHVVCIIIRYNTLESYNQQAAVLPSLYSFLYTKYHVHCELFASSINSHQLKYGSLYYDLEKTIGSVGNFFNITIQKGFYVANPPFDDTIMRNMSYRLVECLEKTTEPLSIFITIPEWDKIEYGGFDCLTILQTSGYIQYIEKVKRNRVIFYNYYEHTQKHLVNVYFILMQNKEGIYAHPIAKEMKIILSRYFPY